MLKKKIAVLMINPRAVNAVKGFANKLGEIAEQLKAQDERIRQVVSSEIKLSGDLKAKDISQKALQGGSTEQEMLKQVKVQNIKLVT